MAQMTQAERVMQIRKEVDAADKRPPDRQYGVDLIQVGGAEYRCPVISFPADDVLLNPRSHRLQSQLQSDPDWQALETDPHSDKAQQLLARYIREARTPEQFKALKDSLEADGQESPGVMTYEGVLINANTRAVALRELADPNKRYVKAAVLPQTVRDSELALLELRLQMQKELKEPYSLTNELLFIEEMYTKFNATPQQIAGDLRLAAGKRGETEVNLRLSLLTFVRQLMTVPSVPLKLRFFDEKNVKLQHLKDLYSRYEALFDKDPADARRLLENWLLSIQVGLTAVHKLREIDQHFDRDYMLPHLTRDEGIGEFVDSLAVVGVAAPQKASTGVTALLGNGAGDPADSSAAGSLLNLLTRDDKRIDVTKPDAKHAVQLDQQDVLEAVKTATFDGVKAKEGDDRDSNQMEAPTKAVKDASAALEKAVAALAKVHDHSDFDNAQRARLVAALKRHRRTLKNTESAFASLGVSID